jgi:GDP-4-dehydro-6-deoxy-D-mannose reductase
MRFFITGISGFAGRHLATHLIESGHWVGGIARQDGALDELRGRRGGLLASAAIDACDIRDRAGLRGALDRARPDGVFHLAAVTFVPKTIEQPELAYEVNFFGTVELLAAVRDVAPRARVVLVTTGEVYGAIDPARDLPIVETQPLRPLSPYSVSKAAADLAGFQTFWSQSLDVVRARPFNHTGPGQPSEFVCSEFARALVAAEMGDGPAKLHVGNLDVERDFSDVRDIVGGYVALFEKGKGGEAYNLGSGLATSVRTVLEELRSLGRTPVAVETDPRKLRPREIPRIVGSIDKIRETTGWRPAIPLRQTLADLMDDWRSRWPGAVR